MGAYTQAMPRNAKAFLALLLLVSPGCQPEPGEPRMTVSIGGKAIAFPAHEWKPMVDEAPYAKNFEATKNTPRRLSQVVTVFVIPMSPDRREGRRISADEYVELFVTFPGSLVAQVRRDHGSYWILSRENFKVDVPGVDLKIPWHQHAFTSEEFDLVLAALRNDIDTTRYLLGDALAAR